MERSEAAEEEEEAGGSSGTLAPQQHSTIWKQIQARAKPLLSPKLGLRDPEKSRWTFRKTKRREETLVVLDRVISSSQPDLLYSSPGEEAAAMGATQATQATQLCGKTVPGGPGKSPGKSPGKLPGKPTVAHLVMSHHKSSSLGSAGLERLAEPRGGEQRATEAPAAGTQPDQQPVTAVSGVSGSSGVQGDQVSVDQVSGVQVDQVSVDQVSVDQVHPPSGMYKLEVEVKRGINLAVRDRGGSSDPYVKLKVGGREVFRTRTIHKNLNPVWNETTSLLLEGLREPVYVKVFDYDFGLHDDFMGSAFIHLESLEQNRTVPVSLVLKDPQYPDQDLGSLELNVTLSPKDSPLEERRDSTTMLLRRSWKRSTKQSSLRLSDRKSQVSGGVVGVALIEGRGLTPMDANGLSDPYVRFRLGQQKYRSKTMPKTLNPQWREQFELHLYEDSCGVLELTVWDRDTGRRDDFMGRTQVDLTQLPRERTHHLELALEEARGLLVLLVTLTGSAHLSRDDLSITPLDDPQERREILQRYGAFKSFRNLRDVGIVQVKVLRAGGLMVADVTGKSDPFCVLELNNERLQTHTVYKNLNPEWNKVFTFNVTDVHSVLEVTVFDEDRDRSADFLGKVAIPLLYVRNGEQKSYVLKNKELTEPTKGTIDLELHLVYNTVKAALRTIVPAEQKYIEEEPKVSKQLLQQNFNRVKRCIMVLIGYGTFINSCFEWESPQRSIISFMVFVVVVWNVELFMVPLALLLLLLWNFFFSCGGGGGDDADLRFEWEDEDEDREDRDSESRGFMEKLYAIQDVFLSVQTALDGVASYAERIKNTANWTVPFLSCLAVTALCSATVLLYLVPLRFLVLVWGVNKFTKKLRNPYLIDNNELLDFLSRVPSDVQVMHYRELKVDPCQSPTKRR